MNKYNHEGYPDPTVYEAFTHIEEEKRRYPERKPGDFRPLVYICSPYSGDTAENVRRACAYSAFAVRCRVIPVTPHLMYPRFMDDTNPEARKLGLFFSRVLLTKCEELWVFGRRISSGMAAEIYRAECRGMPIRYFDENCEEMRPYGS